MNTMTKNSQVSVNGTHSTVEDIEAEDHHVSQSSILYLLQEASKLALPAKALDYAEPGSAKVSNENPKPTHSPLGTLCPSQFHGDKSEECATQPGFLGSFSFVHACAGSSPWEVMSLINQQCERLLHSRQMDGRQEDSTALSTSYPSGSVCVCLSSNSAHLEMLECNKKHTCFSSVPLLTVSVEKENCTSLSDGGETNLVKGEVHVAQSTGAVTEYIVQSAQNTDKEAADAQVNLSDHNYSFAVSTKCTLLNHQQGERLDSQCSELVVVSPCTKNPPQSDQTPASVCQVDRKPPCSLFRKTSEPAPRPSSFMEPGLVLVGEGPFKTAFGCALDCNNNVQPHSLLPTKPPVVHTHRGAGVSRATLGLSLPVGLLALDHKHLCDQAEGECTQTPKAETQTQVQGQVQPAPQPAKWQSRTPRKQAHPSRSADPCDPSIQGVIFNMNAKLDDGTNQCRLLITSKYSKYIRKRTYGSRRCQALRLPKEASSSEDEEGEEEESEPSRLSTSKTCASCCTRKTPLWRDAEDGTPLCNACGIRYKKYRVRCTNCWHIPRKDGKSRSQCFKCGDALRLTSSHHKRASW